MKIHRTPNGQPKGLLLGKGSPENILGLPDDKFLEQCRQAVAYGCNSLYAILYCGGGGDAEKQNDPAVPNPFNMNGAIPTSINHNALNVLLNRVDFANLIGLTVELYLAEEENFPGINDGILAEYCREVGKRVIEGDLDVIFVLSEEINAVSNRPPQGGWEVTEIVRRAKIATDALIAGMGGRLRPIAIHTNPDWQDAIYAATANLTDAYALQSHGTPNEVAARVEKWHKATPDRMVLHSESGVVGLYDTSPEGIRRVVQETLQCFLAGASGYSIYHGYEAPNKVWDCTTWWSHNQFDPLYHAARRVVDALSKIPIEDLETLQHNTFAASNENARIIPNFDRWSSISREMPFKGIVNFYRMSDAGFHGQLTFDRDDPHRQILIPEDTFAVMVRANSPAPPSTLKPKDLEAMNPADWTSGSGGGLGNFAFSSVEFDGFKMKELGANAFGFLTSKPIVGACEGVLVNFVGKHVGVRIRANRDDESVSAQKDGGVPVSLFINTSHLSGPKPWTFSIDLIDFMGTPSDGYVQVTSIKVIE